MGDLVDIAMAHPFWLWAAVGAALLAVEVALGSGWLLWPAAAAGVVALVLMAVPLGWPAALGLFAVLTIVATVVSRRFVKRLDPHHDRNINDSTARLIGHRGKTVTAFDDTEGRVFIDGKEWAAELDGDARLAAGAPVEVTGVSGSRLRVRPAH